MQIESGKIYVTADGQKVGPLSLNPQPAKGGHDYWMAEGQLSDGSRKLWFQDGTFWPTNSPSRNARNAGFDLVAEWTDTPDLTKLTTPYGLLDDATREALKAHGGPYECWEGREWREVPPSWFGEWVYRVKPQPPKPRELWLRINHNGDWRECSEDAFGARLFREVTD